MGKAVREVFVPREAASFRLPLETWTDAIILHPIYAGIHGPREHSWVFSYANWPLGPATES